MKSYGQFIETVVNRMVKDALDPQKKTAELAADAEPSVSDLRKQADMLCQKMDEATNTLIAGLTELGLYPAQKGTKTAEKIPSPNAVGIPAPYSERPYPDPNQPKPVPRHGPEQKPHSDTLKFGINLYDHELHDKLYANRESELAGLTALQFGPAVAQQLLPETPQVKASLGAIAAGTRAHINNSDVVSQNALKWGLLKNENNAKKINTLAARVAINKVLKPSDQDALLDDALLDRLKDTEWLKQHPIIGSLLQSIAASNKRNKSLEERQYHNDSILRYFNAAKDVANDQPHAMLPELGSTQGQITSAIAATTPLWGKHPVIKGLGFSSLGLNAIRAVASAGSFQKQLDSLYNDAYAPEQPTMTQFLTSNFPSQIDMKAISEIPANQQYTYLKQQDKNNGVLFRIPPDKTKKQQMQESMPDIPLPENLIPTGNELEGVPVYKRNGKYVRGDETFSSLIKEFVSHLSDEAKKHYSEALAAVSQGPDPTPRNKYDTLKLRTQYPSGAAK
jgi:hypothetical protein